MPRDGRRGAAPDAPPPFQDLSLPNQPRDRSRPLGEILAAEGIGPGSRIGVDRLEDVRRPGDARGAGLPRGRAPPPGRPGGAGRERRRPADRRGRRAARRQRGRAAGLSRVGRLPDLRRRAPAAGRPATRHDRAGGRPAAALERDAALLPPHADGRPAGVARAAQPGRPADRARGPIHHRLRDLGRAQLPGRLRRGGRVRAVRGNPRLRGSPRRPLLRGGRRLVRGAPRRADRRSAPGDRGPPPRRPVLRHLTQPGPPDRARRVGRVAGRTGLDDRASVGDGPPGGHHPRDRDGLLHHEHRRRHRPRRCIAARDACRAVPRRLGPHHGAAPVHGRGARHRPSPGRAAACRTFRHSCPRSCSGPTGR